MKKLLNLTIAAGALFTLTACASTSPMLPDTKSECSVSANGIEKVIASAVKYNAEAKAKGLEFRRLGVNNSGLIESVQEAIKTGAKEFNPKDFKGKPSKTKLETTYAAERACKFAISALTQAEEAKTTWRLAVPGDGYKY